MMSDSKLSSRPPSMGGAQSSLDEFIGGASVHTPEPGVAVAPAPGTSSRRTGTLSLGSAWGARGCVEGV